MKTINLTVFSFDELSENVQKKIIEREHWNVMEQCMDAYGIDYKKSMKAFEDMTDTRVYNWEVGYERYDFSYEFKYKDPIYEHPTDYHRDIFPENLCGKLLFRYNKIGEVFKYDIGSGIIELAVIEDDGSGCDGCIFNDRNYYCKNTCCINVDRKDSTDIIYKEVKRS